MADNYTILHLHSSDSNPCSALEVDSITPFQSYIDKAKECGMQAIAFTEHGSVLHNISKKQSCEKLGIKYINAEEFYVTEDIDMDNLIRDNYHCCLYAKNYNGVLELNKLSSNAFNREDGHFYYNPRITMNELENTSDNILILTACTGGILCKGNKTIQERFLNFIIKNKHRCWLEIQPHNFDMQIEYNRYLYKISKEHNLKLIATNDVHAITKDHLDGRKVMQRSKNVIFEDEDACDLVFKNYDEFIALFEIQNSVPKDIYMDAIEETNNFAEMIESYKLDYNNKYPRIYEDAENEFKQRIVKGIKERGVDKLPNYKSEYIPRIQDELKTYKHNDAIDFMLLDSDYKLWLLENNMSYGVSRGSVSGSEIAYLIHCTDVDSIKYKLNFSRFMNSERMSLADVDTDIYAEDRYKVREFLFNKKEINCCNIITFNTIQLKTAIKDIGRAFNMTPDETQQLSDMVQQDEKKHDYMPEEIRNKYPEMFKYVDMVIGTITSLGRHAAGIVCSPTDVSYDFGTLSIKSDPRPVSQIDMHEIDSLNYVKLDLLGLNAVGLIDGACKLANIDYLIPDNIDFTDENVINSIAEDTTLIFQFESGFASDLLKLTLSKESISNMKKKSDNISYLDIMAMVNGAIRPSGESYRDDMSQGIYKDNGNKELNEFLKPTLGYLIYQEQIIDFLHDFCGFTMGQADIVRRHFAKKKPEEIEKDIPIIENGGYMVDIKGNKDTKYVKGFVAIAQEKYRMTKEEAKETIKYFIKVIDDASLYIFSKNHSVPYSMIGFFIGWLRYYYKIELLTSALNVYQDNSEKMNNIKLYINSQGIEIKGIRFGKSKADYFMDKEENTIYQGIASIKYCNVDIANELYQLAHENKYTSFIDLLTDIKQKISVDASKLKILTGLNFFSDFGHNKYLLNVTELYDNIYSKKQINKKDLDKLGLSEYLIKKYSNKETECLYKEIDNIGLINEMCKTIENKPMSIIEHIKFEVEYLGCTTYINPTVNEKYYVVLDFKTYKNPLTPYLIIRNIKTGEEIKTKITSGKTFKENPFGRYSILKIFNLKDSFKKKKIGEDWVVTNELEQVLVGYEVIK